MFHSDPRYKTSSAITLEVSPKALIAEITWVGFTLGSWWLSGLRLHSDKLPKGKKILEPSFEVNVVLNIEVSHETRPTSI